MPIVGREQPGPTQDIPRSDRLQFNRVSQFGMSFETHLALLNQIKEVGNVSFSKNDLIRFKAREHSALSQDLGIVAIQATQEGVTSHDFKQSRGTHFHDS